MLEHFRMTTCPTSTSALQDTGQAVVDPLLGRVVEPVDPQDVLPALEKEKGRNAHDLQLFAEVLAVPGVDLDDFDVRKFPGGPFQDRNKRLAGGARRREEVHENGNPRLHDLLLELRLADFDEMLSRTHLDGPSPFVGFMRRRSARQWASEARQGLSSTG